ncbi:hypothetical protein D3C76_1628440 [compost metagenome]
MFASKLAACGIDVRSVLQPDADADVLLLELVVKAQNCILVAALVLAVLVDGIVRDQVDVDRRSPVSDQLRQFQRMLALVIDLPQQNILQRYPLVRFLHKVVDRRQ